MGIDVSTLIYSVRENWSQQRERVERDWRRVRRLIVLVAIGIGPGVFLVERLVDTVAWRSFLAEAFSLCLYAAAAVWYALRRRPTLARRMALIVYLIGLAIMGVVDFITKRGLSTLLVDSSRANAPSLWVGALMLGFIPLLGWLAWRYPIRMGRVGLGPVYPFSSRAPGPADRRVRYRVSVPTSPPAYRHLGPYLLAGLGVGLLVGLHFWLTTRAAGMTLSVKPWPYVAWQFFYEVGPQSLTEELFMRGVVFNTLYFGRGWNFWLAALAASSLELLSLLVKGDYSADVLVVVGVIFYTVASSIASAGLFRWSRSVLPGYVNNVTFGVVSLFR